MGQELASLMGVPHLGQYTFSGWSSGFSSDWLESSISSVQMLSGGESASSSISCSCSACDGGSGCGGISSGSAVSGTLVAFEHRAGI